MCNEWCFFLVVALGEELRTSLHAHRRLERISALFFPAEIQAKNALICHQSLGTKRIRNAFRTCAIVPKRMQGSQTQGGVCIVWIVSDKHQPDIWRLQQSILLTYWTIWCVYVSHKWIQIPSLLFVQYLLATQEEEEARRLNQIVSKWWFCNRSIFCADFCFQNEMDLYSTVKNTNHGMFHIHIYIYIEWDLVSFLLVTRWTYSVFLCHTSTWIERRWCTIGSHHQNGIIVYESKVDHRSTEGLCVCVLDPFFVLLVFIRYGTT